MIDQRTDEQKQDLLLYLNKTNFLLSLLYDIDLLPEQVANEPLKQYRMFQIIAMYRLLNNKQP
jgi:hypothetical protein